MTDARLNEFSRRMDGALEALRKEFGGLRTGRASAHLLDQVVVQAYGSPMPLNQVGTVSVPEPRMITVNVWDRSLVGAVEKAIRDGPDRSTTEEHSDAREHASRSTGRSSV